MATIEMPDRCYKINCVIDTSGNKFIIGSTDENIVIEAQDEATYMSVTEARLIIAGLKAAISEMGV